MAVLSDFKKCSKCNEIYPLSTFNKCSKTKDGFRSECNFCRKLESIKYRKNNIDKIKKNKEQFKMNNPEYEKLYQREYYNKNPHYYAWRGILKSSLKRMNKNKETYTIELLGYSALELKEHITSLFTDGMSWDNWGEWHIDHIKPVCSFDKDTQPSKVNSLSNLRPLWATTREINGVLYEGNLNRN